MKAHQGWLALALACAMGASSADTQHEVQPVPPTAAQLPIEGNFPSIDGAVEWFNSPPLTTAGLRGKVVLVEFWTYTCVNWRRTLPYVRAWAERYRDSGLVVIGVHTPEFDIEKNIDHIRQAAKDMNIGYPIAIDSGYRIWNAFNNQYWPALYFIDANGHIRHHQFGEGEYQQSELVIQRLLAETGNGTLARGLTSVAPNGFELAADWSDLKSPESYVGYARADAFASPGGAVPDKRHHYSVPARLELNHWGVAGDWTFGKDAAVSNAANGRMAYRFHARDLNLIMVPTVPGASVRFRVLIDGQPPGAAHGVDVDSQGNGTVTESRMYQLIRQPQPIADRLFEIEFLDPGIGTFDFTFG
jgi:thiol-disulfide isomerase/thioredoxin